MAESITELLIHRTTRNKSRRAIKLQLRSSRDLRNTSNIPKVLISIILAQFT
jgi:hypothetical protein